MASGKIDAVGKFLPALLDLIRLLQHSGSEGVLIGGIAVALQGYQRATRDIDMLLWGENIDISELLQQAHESGFEPRASDPLAFALQNYVIPLVHQQTGIPVDIALAFTPFEQEAISNKILIQVYEVAVPVARPEDLLIMKCVSQRPIDLADIAELYKIYADQIDLLRVRYWVEQFAEALEEPDLWARVQPFLQRD